MLFRSKRGKGDYRIGRKMVGLKAVEVEERAKKVRGGKAESTLEVSNENHPLTGLRGGRSFISGAADRHRGADPA